MLDELGLVRKEDRLGVENGGLTGMENGGRNGVENGGINGMENGVGMVFAALSVTD